MSVTKVEFRGIPGTEAAVGRTGEHSLVADRPAGVAGGQGLGFNGGQMLGLAIGGCMCNDLRYVAHSMGINLTSLAVDVVLHVSDDPRLVTDADVQIKVESDDPKADLRELIKRARADTTIGNSLVRGINVRYPEA
ncbi:MAG TPA: OsmC family protein [Dongiaceae bacterium]|nr:OsmC family protein [Dongiaceae bacterium]